MLTYIDDEERVAQSHCAKPFWEYTACRQVQAGLGWGADTLNEAYEILEQRNRDLWPTNSQVDNSSLDTQKLQDNIPPPAHSLQRTINGLIDPTRLVSQFRPSSQLYPFLPPLHNLSLAMFP